MTKSNKLFKPIHSNVKEEKKTTKTTNLRPIVAYQLT